jgi:hypothetical protein
MYFLKNGVNMVKQISKQKGKAYSDMPRKEAIRLKKDIAQKREYQKQWGRPSKPNVIYHGSSKQITEFELQPHYLADDDPVIFGTPNRVLAICYLASWSDNDFYQYTEGDDGVIYLEEQYSGAFDKVYKGKMGYLYELSPETFEWDYQLSRSEFVSRVEPIILQFNFINVYDALLDEIDKGNLKVIKYKTETRKNPKEQTDNNIIVRDKTSGAIIFKKALLLYGNKVLSLVVLNSCIPKLQNVSRKEKDSTFLDIVNESEYIEALRAIGQGKTDYSKVYDEKRNIEYKHIGCDIFVINKESYTDTDRPVTIIQDISTLSVYDRPNILITQDGIVPSFRPIGLSYNSIKKIINQNEMVLDKNGARLEFVRVHHMIERNESFLSADNQLWVLNKKVSQGLYKKVMGEYPGSFPDNPNKPATGLTIKEVCEFCNKLSVLYGLSEPYEIKVTITPIQSSNTTFTQTTIKHNSKSFGFRLPLPAEWLLLLRKGFTANDFSNIAQYAFDITNKYQAMPFDNAQKKPDRIGLYDLVGNTKEYTSELDKHSNVKSKVYGWSYEQRIPDVFESFKTGKTDNDFIPTFDGYNITPETRRIMEHIGFRLVLNKNCGEYLENIMKLKEELHDEYEVNFDD